MKLTKNRFLKPIISTIIIAFLIFPAKAQNSYVGIKGGMNLSYLTVDDADENNILPGFQAGVFGRIGVNDKIGLQPELLFSMKGVKTVYSEQFMGVDVAEGETKLNVNYIDIPVYLTLNFTEALNVHFGPYMGVLLNAKGSTDTEILNSIDINEEEEIDRDEYNPVDFGLSGGVGLSFEPLVLGVNYSMGLRQVAKEDAAMETLLGDAKNNSIKVYVGIRF